MQSQIGTVSANGGGDGPEDWVGAYKIAVNNMNWRKGIRLLIHIADAPAHGNIYGGDCSHQSEAPKLKPYIQQCATNNIKIIGMYIDSYAEPSFRQCQREYDEITNKEKLYRVQSFSAGSDLSSYFKESVVEAAICAAPKS